MFKFNVTIGDDVKVGVRYFNHRDNAVSAMIKYADNLKAWCSGVMEFQTNKHDLDCHLQAIDVFIDGVSTHLLQVNEIQTEDKA